MTEIRGVTIKDPTYEREAYLCLAIVSDIWFPEIGWVERPVVLMKDSMGDFVGHCDSRHESGSNTLFAVRGRLSQSVDILSHDSLSNKVNTDIHSQAMSLERCDMLKSIKG
jgi:hypothetical protein